MQYKKKGQATKTKRRRITTVQDILAKDDVNTIMAHLHKAKPEMESLIAIYNDGETTRWEITEGTPLSDIICQLEDVKISLLTGNWVED